MFTNEEKSEIRDWLTETHKLLNEGPKPIVGGVREKVKEIYDLLSPHFAPTFATDPYNYAHDALARAKYLPTESAVTVIGTSSVRDQELVVFIDTDGMIKGDLPMEFERVKAAKRVAVPEFQQCEDFVQSEENVGKRYLLAVQPTDRTARKYGLIGMERKELVVAQLTRVVEAPCPNYNYRITEVFSKPDSRYLRVGMSLGWSDVVDVIGLVEEGN